MGFLLFFLGIITGATIVFLVVCPIVNYMFNYVQDMKEFLKDKESKTNGEYTYVTNKHIDLEWRYFLRYGREI